MAGHLQLNSRHDLAHERSRIGHRPAWLLALALPTLFVALFFVLPAANLVLRGVLSAGSAESSGWLGAAEWRAVWFTLWQAALSTVLSVVLAFPLAWLLYRRSFAGRGLARALIMVPFILPSVVVGLAFLQLQRPGGLLETFSSLPSAVWLIAANLFYNIALAARTIGAAWANIDPSGFEAAQMLGARPIRAFVVAVWPRLRAAVVSSAALIFLFCATSFGLVLILGGGQLRTIETEIWTSAVQNLDLTTAAQLAIVQTVISISAYMFSARLNHQRIDIARDRSQPVRLARRERWVAVLTALPALALMIVPMASLVVSSLRLDGGWTFANYSNLIAQNTSVSLDTSVALAAVNSLRNAVVAGAVATALGMLAAYGLTRPASSRLARRVQSAIGGLMLLPIGVSAVVLGLGYLITFGAPTYLRSSWVMIPIAQALIAMPIVVQLITAPVAAFARSTLPDSAAMLGANRAQTMWHIELPVLRPIVQTAFAYALLTSLGEFGAANFLALPDQGTVPTVLFRLISRPGVENFGMAMAISVVFTALALVLAAVASMQRRHGAPFNRARLTALDRPVGVR